MSAGPARARPLRPPGGRGNHAARGGRSGHRRLPERDRTSATDLLFQPVGKLLAPLGQEPQVVQQSLGAGEVAGEPLTGRSGGLPEAVEGSLGTSARAAERLDQLGHLAVAPPQAAEALLQAQPQHERHQQQRDDQPVHGQREHHSAARSRRTRSSIRIATWSPRRPIRPRSIGTWPQRSTTALSGPAVSGSVVPTARRIASPRLIVCSSSRASSSTVVTSICLARCDSQIEVAPELLAHEHLQEQIPHRLQGGVGDQNLERAAAIVELDPQLEQDGGVGRTGDGSEARIGLEPLVPELDRAERREGRGHLVQHQPDQTLDQRALDLVKGRASIIRVGAAPRRPPSSTSTIEQISGLSTIKAVVVPLDRLEDRDHRRQGHALEVIAEAQRGNLPRVSSTFSEVKLRRLVVMIRTRRSSTTSSIGNRS